MMEFMKDILIILVRIATILPLLLLMTLFMGRRAIGELPVFDFLIVVILGALVGADIADPNIEHLPTAIAIVAVAVFQRIVSRWKISNRKVGRLLTFEPTVVVQNGKMIHENMRKLRYSIDNILQMLREKGIFDIREVETAVIEGNGSISVLKRPQASPVTRGDMNLTNTTSSISFPVIVEGKIYSNVLQQLHVDEEWLRQQIASRQVAMDDVFFASVNRELKLHISLKQDQGIDIPPIIH